MIGEDLDLFFDDDGVSFTAGAISGMCLKDMPGMGILGDLILSVDAYALVKTSEFGNLVYNDPVTVDGEAYIVKKPAMPIDDGAFSLLILEKPDTVASTGTVVDGNANDSEIDSRNEEVTEYIFDGNDS